MTRFDFPQLINDNVYKVAAEIGVQRYGYFSYYLLRHSDLALYSIDIWGGRHTEAITGASIEAEARSHLAEFGSRSNVMRSASIDAATMFNDSTFDFIYINGNHRKESVTDDMQAWYPKVRSGGILAGHDYVDVPHCGVIGAVDEFMASHTEQLKLTDEVWRSWFFVKA